MTRPFAPDAAAGRRGRSSARTRGDAASDAERRSGIVTALLRLARLVDGELRAAVSAIGLTPAQAETLRFAARTRPDMATPGQLARILGVRPPTAVGIVAPLIERGLILRLPHPDDGRRTILRLSPDGERLYERLAALTSELDATLAALPPASLDRIEGGMAELVAALVRSGRLVVAAPCAGCVHFRPNVAPGSERPHRCTLIRRDLSPAEAAMECPEHKAAAS